ncbi:MAG: L-fucose:H+ symporter permease [Bacteroidetes bacterium]|nr:L-fucose:H+ symporter permease [Bacteroidota bacterium]MBS1541971.1 L-fucose:H+ symporter permease [Bacteroidota bacterium]
MAASVSTLNASDKRSWFPFALITSLFFFWGFVNNLDPILIPHLRQAFSLSYLQSSLIDSAVFIGYFLMALPAGMIMKKYGYKSGIVLGLLLFGAGALLFIPAADTRQYIFFLIALFVIATGLTLLETAANPYATILGSPETAAQRLNFAQSFNGLGVVLAPLIGGKFILSEKTLSASERALLSPEELARFITAEASSVKLPYLILGLTILAVAVLFLFTKLPDMIEQESKNNIAHVLKHKHLRWAVMAQLFYVGAQVCVVSFFINMATQTAGLSQQVAATYLGLGYGLAFMSGRFAGTFFMRFIAPNKLLSVYALINIVLSAIAIFTEGMLTVYALIGIGFFMSIMFPTIFALGIVGLGNDTKLGSSLIVMSVVGGALLPPFMGYFSDLTGNIQNGYFIPMLCYIVVFFFGWKFYRPVPIT